MSEIYDGVDKIVADYLKALAARAMTDDRLWVLLFPDWSDAARTALRNGFRSENARPTIRLAFPRSKERWPVWAVFLQQEAAPQQYLGMAEGGVLQAVLEEGDDPADYEQYGMGTQQTIQIMVVSADSPDVCRWHALIAKRMMMAGARYFHQYISAMEYGGAQDIAPDPRYLPENLFVREQRWTFGAEEVVLELMEDEWAVLRGPVAVALDSATVDEEGTPGGVVPYSDTEGDDGAPGDLP
jgi:hypothetical protein